MNKFQELIEITDRLMGPGGCPWDQEQTMKSIRASTVEEACELKEAIESEDNEHIKEELGDLFFHTVFLSRLAEKENRFSMEEALSDIKEKLIRRHPHVFGEVKLNDSEAVKEQWEQIKKSEKGKMHRKSALDNLPSGLPVVVRAQKVLKKITKAGFPMPEHSTLGIISEDDLAHQLLDLLVEAMEKGFDIEHALKKRLKKLEHDFRLFEKNKAS